MGENVLSSLPDKPAFAQGKLMTAFVRMSFTGDIVRGTCSQREEAEVVCREWHSLFFMGERLISPLLLNAGVNKISPTSQTQLTTYF